jgi:hypothetical protein
MILHIHSDASYLSVSNARSRLGGLFFLGGKSPEPDMLNGSILNVASVIKNLVASPAESEVGACFHSAQSGAPLRVTLTRWAMHNPRRLSAPISPLHSASWTTQSHRNDQNQWTCDTIGWPTEFAKNNLMFIGDQDVKISAIITQNSIQRNITRICADSYYIKQIVFRFCECVLNYFRQPSLRSRMDARTNQSAQRATQLGSVLARVNAVSRQNQITTTVPYF